MKAAHTRLTKFHKLWVVVLGWCSVAVVAAQELEPPAVSSAPAASWLVIERVGEYGRAPVHTDAIEAQIVAGKWHPPHAGDTVRVSDEVTRTWQEASIDEDGWLHHDALNGGYACLTVAAQTEHVMLLDAAGHNMVYVNGVPRAGDPYQTGWTLLPVRLLAGVNTFLFHVGRGQVRAQLVEPKSHAQFNTRDPTLPDVVTGRGSALWAALPVINATPETMRNLLIETFCGRGAPTQTALPAIPPLTVRKVPFRIEVPDAADAAEIEVEIELCREEAGEPQALDSARFTLPVRGPHDRYKRTFVSEIDGSVQYFAVTPVQRSGGEPETPALVLTLHGAGVEATGQAAAYAPKTWANILAPTNRRPFGFDWEDWGRIDALEVLAQCDLPVDPQHVYLTGHSMGGHGVWQIGVTYPDLFAAIGPSAAWPDFWSYAGAADYDDPTPIEQILARAVAPSRTLTLERNYLHYGVYILHGDQDDNVPVSLARKMLLRLAEFHRDLAYYEKPGAGHWWGNECVDWPPLFDFFKCHERQQTAAVRHIEFHTANPGISASSHWVAIEAQTRPLEPSSVQIDLDPQTRSFTGTTQNVARLRIDLTALSERPDPQAGTQPALPPNQPLTIRLDAQTLENIPWPEAEPHVWLRRDEAGWTVISRPAAAEKGPQRYGPFKEAFGNHVVFVYGTQGAEAQTAAIYDKARYDAETFWYRGNGAVEVLPDVDFDPSQERDRNVIIYGNADTNAAWAALLGESPVQVRRGAITIAQRELTGDDLACLVLRPRPGSDRALVGVVAGTGVAGMRLTERLPYFVSGVAYPDWIVLGPEMLSSGTAGVRGAGFFGSDWGVESGALAWHD